jgi:rhamnosyltransferase
MISILIPVYNGSHYLPALLSRLQSQSRQDIEIIVLDSDSEDGSRDIACSFGVRLIRIPHGSFDHGDSRTLAAKNAKGDILVYLSQDVMPIDEYAIANLIKPLETDARIGLVYGRQLPFPDASPFAGHLRHFNYGPTSYERQLDDIPRFGLNTVFFSNAFAAYRKSALANAGYFPGGIIFGEDTLTAARMLLNSSKLAYAADAQAFHSHNYSAIQEFRRYFDIGVFHSSHDWLLKTFGKPESRGWRYLKSELCYLFRQRQHLRYPECIARNGMKLIGYRMGRLYRYLPEFVIPCLSMNKRWWNKTSAGVSVSQQMNRGSQ